jgi:hypothetical protein
MVENFGLVELMAWFSVDASQTTVVFFLPEILLLQSLGIFCMPLIVLEVHIFCVGSYIYLPRNSFF